MTHEFKVGDTVIVLPSLYLEHYAGRCHELQPYTSAKVLEFENNGQSVNCIGSACCLEWEVEQTLELHQIAPLPIPYSQLDEE